jgi:hypothetical protein
MSQSECSHFFPAGKLFLEKKMINFAFLVVASACEWRPLEVLSRMGPTCAKGDSALKSNSSLWGM